MCAELNPTDCHRSLICDYLKLNGFIVHHLLKPGAVIEHQAHPDARLKDNTISYAGNTQIELNL